jgi:hypothetical protein
MAYFQTKNTNLGKFWRALEWKGLVYSLAVWYILWSFGNLVAIWYICLRFGTLCEEKSGNPEEEGSLFKCGPLLLLVSAWPFQNSGKWRKWVIAFFSHFS